MRRLAPLLCSLALACSKPAVPAPPATAQSAAPVVAASSAPSAKGLVADDSGAADDAADPGRRTTLEDLPAVSADGKRVAFARSVSDGARARTNLALVILDVDGDRQRDSVVIDDPSDPERPGREQRVAAASRLLAADRWSPLVALHVEENAKAPERQGMMITLRANVAVGEGLVVDYREPLLVIREGSRELVHRVAPTFSGNTRCPVLANTEAAWGHRALGVLLIEVEYRGGTDLCWEPDQTFHAVRLPGP